MPSLWASLTRVLNSLIASLPQFLIPDAAYRVMGEKKLIVEYPQKFILSIMDTHNYCLIQKSRLPGAEITLCSLEELWSMRENMRNLQKHKNVWQFSNLVYSKRSNSSHHVMKELEDKGFLTYSHPL